MDKVIEMLKKMGLEIVQETIPDIDYGLSDRGEVVVKVDDKFFKTVYYVDSYGGDLSIESTKEVTPKPVQKVEYV